MKITTSEHKQIKTVSKLNKKSNTLIPRRWSKPNHMHQTISMKWNQSTPIKTNPYQVNSKQKSHPSRLLAKTAHPLNITRATTTRTVTAPISDLPPHTPTTTHWISSRMTVRSFRASKPQCLNATTTASAGSAKRKQFRIGCVALAAQSAASARSRRCKFPGQGSLHPSGPLWVPRSWKNIWFLIEFNEKSTQSLVKFDDF